MKLIDEKDEELYAEILETNPELKLEIYEKTYRNHPLGRIKEIEPRKTKGIRQGGSCFRAYG